MTGDSAGSTTIEAMWNELNETAAGDDNLVILMHDAGNKNLTYETLPDIINYLKENGYKFKTIYDIL